MTYLLNVSRRVSCVVLYQQSLHEITPFFEINVCFHYILTYSVERESQSLTQAAEGWGLHTIDGEPQGRNTLYSSMGRKRLFNF